MKKLLFIDDDQVLQKVLKTTLRDEFEVVACHTLEEARSAIARHTDIVLMIVDRRLPDGDGLTFTSEVRRHEYYAGLPIVFLSGMISESDRISGFFAGADDYVTKPFSILELKARIMARLRSSANSHLQFGGLELDLDGHRAHLISGETKEEISLTRIEFKILVALVQASGSVLNREVLLRKIWGDGTHVGDRAIDSHVSHLRKKIAQSGVQVTSLRGEGYRIHAVSPSTSQAA